MVGDLIRDRWGPPSQPKRGRRGTYSHAQLQSFEFDSGQGQGFPLYFLLPLCRRERRTTLVCRLCGLRLRIASWSLRKRVGVGHRIDTWLMGMRITRGATVCAIKAIHPSMSSPFLFSPFLFGDNNAFGQWLWLWDRGERNRTRFAYTRTRGQASSFVVTAELFRPNFASLRLYRNALTTALQQEQVRS